MEYYSRNYNIYAIIPKDTTQKKFFVSSTKSKFENVRKQLEKCERLASNKQSLEILKHGGIDCFDIILLKNIDSHPEELIIEKSFYHDYIENYLFVLNRLRFNV